MRRLINRRLVPVRFDVDDRGVLGDRAARQFTLRALPALGDGRDRSPPVLLIRPDGKVLATFEYSSPSEIILGTIHTALSENPAFDRPSADERTILSPLQQAEVFIDLGRDAAATRILQACDGPLESYALGHLARLRGEWEAMEDAFRRVNLGELEDDLRMERAYRDWLARDFETLERTLERVPRSSNRYAEARYYLGLARYHSGRVGEALAEWQGMVVSEPEGPWVYRADWAFCNVLEPVPRGYCSGDEPLSLLGRVGYLGPANPDIALPSLTDDCSR